MSKEIIIEKLKHPNTLTRLRFKQIESETDHILTVSYYGHEVGGSYVNDTEVAPKYVEDLEYSTNRRVEWTGRSCGGFGSDLYFFKVHINDVINPNPYIPTGEILRVANSYFCFESEGGREWGLVYISHKAILKNEVSGGLMSIRDNTIYFGDIAIARIVEYEPEKRVHYNIHTTSYNRTRFHAIYDLLISKRELDEIFFNTLKQIVNSLLSDKGITCENAYVQYVNDYSDKIEIALSTGQHISIGPNWNIFNSDDAKRVSTDYTNVHVSFLTKWIPNNREHFIGFKTPPTINELLKGCKEPYVIKINGERVSDKTTLVKNKDEVIFSYIFEL